MITIREASETLYKASRDLLVPEKYDEALNMAIHALEAWDGLMQRRDFLLYKANPTDEDIVEFGKLDLAFSEYYGRFE